MHIKSFKRPDKTLHPVLSQYDPSLKVFHLKESDDMHSFEECFYYAFKFKCLTFFPKNSHCQAV